MRLSLKKRLDNVDKIWDNINVRVRVVETDHIALRGSEVDGSRGHLVKEKTWLLPVNVREYKCWVSEGKETQSWTVLGPLQYSRWKENWEPLETNLWELEVSQSVMTFSVMLTNRKKELRFRYSGGVRFPSRDSFLIPFGSQSPELSVRWEGLRKKKTWVRSRVWVTNRDHRSWSEWWQTWWSITDTLKNNGGR
jgi:hypothetical protein